MFPKRIVAIGASTCAGQGDPAEGGFVGRLRRWSESQNPHHQVFNLGISAQTTTDVLARLETELKPRNPQLIILHLGVNDIRRNESGAADSENSLPVFDANVRQLLTVAQKQAQVICVGPHPIDETKTTPVGWRPIYYFLADVMNYSTRAHVISTEMNVPYLNMCDAWLAMDYKKYLDSDGLHPNPAGHQDIFERLQSQLMKLYPA